MNVKCTISIFYRLHFCGVFSMLDSPLCRMQSISQYQCRFTAGGLITYLHCTVIGFRMVLNVVDPHCGHEKEWKQEKCVGEIKTHVFFFLYNWLLLHYYTGAATKAASVVSMLVPPSCVLLLSFDLFGIMAWFVFITWIIIESAISFCPGKMLSHCCLVVSLVGHCRFVQIHLPFAVTQTSMWNIRWLD